MMAKRIALLGAIGTLALGLGACTDGYGYGGVATGYGDGYYDGGYGGGYDGYGYGGAYGYSPSSYGWYNDYYYPGVGIYVYDRNRRPYRWNDGQRRYWQGRRGNGGAPQNWQGSGGNGRPGWSNGQRPWRGYGRHGAAPGQPPVARSDVRGQPGQQGSAPRAAPPQGFNPRSGSSQGGGPRGRGPRSARER